jgi:phospholipid transport system transporter-binding protein
MSDLFNIQFDGDSRCYRVSGELTLDTASSVLTESQALFDKAPQLDIDLAQVSRADSAGLALLITWMRQAKQSDKTISFAHLPEQMLAIAKASGLDAILPLK